jgi:hypothetical protein
MTICSVLWLAGNARERTPSKQALLTFSWRYSHPCPETRPRAPYFFSRTRLSDSIYGLFSLTDVAVEGVKLIGECAPDGFGGAEQFVEVALAVGGDDAFGAEAEERRSVLHVRQLRA